MKVGDLVAYGEWYTFNVFCDTSPVGIVIGGPKRKEGHHDNWLVMWADKTPTWENDKDIEVIDGSR